MVVFIMSDSNPCLHFKLHTVCLFIYFNSGAIECVRGRDPRIYI